MNIAALSPPVTPVNIIFGGKLARQLPRLNAETRAYLAHLLVTGQAVLRDPTRSQMARVFGVTEGMIATFALGKTPAPMTDAAVERLIARVGADRILAALDRITAPAAAAASDVTP
jgi:hypothetical protein